MAHDGIMTYVTNAVSSDSFKACYYFRRRQSYGRDKEKGENMLDMVGGNFSRHGPCEEQSNVRQVRIKKKKLNSPPKKTTNRFPRYVYINET
jgi:hypothetical protein